MPKRSAALNIQGNEADRVSSTELERSSSARKSTVGLVGRDKFREAVRGLQELTTLKNDKGDSVAFDGEAKEAFIELFEKAYPVVGSMIQSLYDMGHLLYEVREALKPQKLFLTWIRYTGIPERTAYNYLRVYESFGERLPEVSHLGIRRLMIVSRVPNCVEYVQKNEETIVKEPAEELERKVKTLKAKHKRGRGGRKPTYTQVEGYKLRPSCDGTKILIEGLSAKKQQAMMKQLKSLLLDGKA